MATGRERLSCSARVSVRVKNVRALSRAGADCAAMSGSGSAVFGLFGSRTAAERAARALAAGGRRTLVTRTLTRAECRRLAGN